MTIMLVPFFKLKKEEKKERKSRVRERGMTFIGIERLPSLIQSPLKI